MKIQRDRFRHPDGYVLEYEVTVPDVVESPYLHILFHGFSRIERHVPPVFARKQWKQAERSVCLSFSDPIHMYTQASCCGWFLLGEEQFAPRMYDLRATLLERHGLRGTVWHGLSSGGYAALKHCMRAGGDDLAFVISPHDDPTILPQWEREAEPFTGLPGMAAPQKTTDIIADWAAPDAGRYLHALVSEKDSYFALQHLRPIMAGLGGHPSARAVMLRDGRGHGFVQDSDYDFQLQQAVHGWESHQAHRDTVAVSIDERYRMEDAVSQAEVVLSAPLARFAGGETRFRVPAGTFREVIGRVYERHPALRQRMADSSGSFLPFVSVYLGEDNIRDLGSLDVVVAPRATVLIMSAVAGG